MTKRQPKQKTYEDFVTGKPIFNEDVNTLLMDNMTYANSISNHCRRTNQNTATRNNLHKPCKHPGK